MIARDEPIRTNSTRALSSMWRPTFPASSTTAASSTVRPTSSPNARSDSSPIETRIHMIDEKKTRTSTPVQAAVDRPNRLSQSTRKTWRYWRNPAMHQTESTR